MRTDLVEPALNHPRLVERSVPTMIVRKDMVDRVLSADGAVSASSAVVTTTRSSTKG